MSNLVLTRRKQDSIILHQDGEELCVITVTSLGPKQVKLAFNAKESVKIDRHEIYEAKQANN
jgi:carbon storage regulator CsrA